MGIHKSSELLPFTMAANQKIKLFLLLVTLSLPALTSAGFGISFAAAPAAVGFSAATVGSLALIGVVGLELGALAGLVFGRGRGRGKRDVNGVNDAFNNVLSEIDQGNIEGCFQKLLCEGAASPVTFAHILPILRSVEFSTRLNLGSQATSVSRHLLEAIKFGVKQTR